MAVGVQSYRSYPLRTEAEAEIDNRIASLDREMYYIIDQFSGWLYVARDPVRYLGNKHSMMEWAGSDKEAYFCE